MTVAAYLASLVVIEVFLQGYFRAASLLMIPTALGISLGICHRGIADGRRRHGRMLIAAEAAFAIIVVMITYVSVHLLFRGLNI